ncbi:MAG: TIGR00730 family Rossman fold protein, partial [Planctomycetota bacterium]
MLKINKEIQFLEGRQSRRKEFYFTLKVAWEFIKGFRTLHFVGPCITIFGSARLGEKTPEYQQTVDIAARISQLGFTIMNCVGPGIMEDAHRGAREVVGRSVGVTFEYTLEQKPNRDL